MGLTRCCHEAQEACRSAAHLQRPCPDRGVSVLPTIKLAAAHSLMLPLLSTPAHLHHRHLGHHLPAEEHLVALLQVGVCRQGMCMGGIIRIYYLEHPLAPITSAVL
jgi:hypothetical protein